MSFGSKSASDLLSLILAGGSHEHQEVSLIFLKGMGLMTNSLFKPKCKKVSGGTCQSVYPMYIIYCDVPGSPCLGQTGPVVGPYFKGTSRGLNG